MRFTIKKRIMKGGIPIISAYISFKEHRWHGWVKNYIEIAILHILLISFVNLSIQCYFLLKEFLILSSVFLKRLKVPTGLFSSATSSYCSSRRLILRAYFSSLESLIFPFLLEIFLNFSTIFVKHMFQQTTNYNWNQTNHGH